MAKLSKPQHTPRTPPAPVPHKSRNARALVASLPIRPFNTIRTVGVSTTHMNRSDDDRERSLRSRSSSRRILRAPDLEHLRPGLLHALRAHCSAGSIAPLEIRRLASG